MIGRRWSCAAVLAVAVATCACPAARRAPSRVLLITLDTTRADHLGCYGAANVQTPVLDALAAEGALFEHALAHAPVTLASHATLFTGRYPPATGVRYNVFFRLSERETTLAERFRADGWATGAFVSAFPLGRPFGTAQGFSAYDEPAGTGEVAVRSAAETIDRALAWMGEQGNARQFVWVHLWEPHWPYRPPFPFSDSFRSRPYDGEIAYVDQQLGRLFDGLRAAGAWDDTLVVVVGDHGEGLYDHGEAEHSLLAYESTLHVPLLVRGPGVRAGTRVATPVGIVDVAPTVVERCALSSLPGVAMQGRSLAAALSGGALSSRPLYFEAMGGSLVHGWSAVEGVRVGPWKLIDSSEPELFEVLTDPGERSNRIGQEPERADDLRATLARLKGEITPDGTTPAESPALDPESRARFASVGYLGGSAGATPTLQGAAPQRMIFLSAEFSRIQRALEVREWEEVLDATAYALSKDPGGRFAMEARTEALLGLQRYPEALASAEELLAHYHDSPEDHDRKGIVLAAWGHHGDAVAAFREGRRLFADHEPLAYHLVLSGVEGGGEDTACREDLPAALRQVEPKGRLYVLAARCALRTGDRAGALAALEAARKSGFNEMDRLKELPEFQALWSTGTAATLPRQGPDGRFPAPSGTQEGNPR